MSQVFRDIAECLEKSELAAKEQDYDPFGTIIGMFSGFNPRASQDVDEIVYGPEPYADAEP